MAIGGARERQRRGVERQADALRHANTLQRHQQDVARFKALADALFPEESTES